MSEIALFHSALGVRHGVTDAADRLRSAGHDVVVVDQYEGRVFDDYTEASAYVDEVGFPTLMGRALAATVDLDDGLITMGFSNGGGMAEFVAASRPGVSGVILAAGALDPAVIGASWPQGVPAQIHNTLNDPWREQASIDAVVAAVEAAGGGAEVFDYPGSGHLFTDSSKTDEYQPAETEEFWPRVHDFIERVA
ncbi:MAG: dienelactone hydrolase [Acidimicrobiia bacterium]|nr:dienelactone hydrolase [Acidimicrobiia bacterium]